MALVVGVASVHAGRGGVPRRVHHHGRSAQEIVIYDRLRDHLPASASRYVMHFETAIEDAVAAFRDVPSHEARGCWMPARAKASYKQLLRRAALLRSRSRRRRPAVELLAARRGRRSERAAFSRRSFDACLNVVTLEHVRSRRT